MTAPHQTAKADARLNLIAGYSTQWLELLDAANLAVEQLRLYGGLTIDNFLPDQQVDENGDPIPYTQEELDSAQVQLDEANAALDGWRALKETTESAIPPYDGRDWGGLTVADGLARVAD